MKTISKNQINKRLQKKRNPEIVETILLAKQKGFLELGKKLSAPSSHYSKINIDKLNEIKSNKIMVVGKVLGQGEIEKKIDVVALGFSKQAKEKLKKAGCEIKSIKQYIKSNANLEDVEIL